MDRFELGVKQIIAQNSRYAVPEIQLTAPLDMYISSFMADRLARDVKRKFSKVDTTVLTNSLFVTLKKVSDLVDHVKIAYV